MLSTRRGFGKRVDRGSRHPGAPGRRYLRADPPPTRKALGLNAYRGGKMPEISFDQFMAVDIRVGTVTNAQPFPEARKPALKLWIDFGAEIGTRKCSAQITQHYIAEALIGGQVIAVVNFPPRQIGPFRSEVLTLGARPGG
jgi:tRNA-binding protein